MKAWLTKAILILLASALVWGCGGKEESTTPLPTVPVKTAKVEAGGIHVVREFAGGLIGISQADLHARVSESVEKLPFEIGDRVKQGDVVVSLNKGGSTSRYYQAQATFENARKNFDKMKNLFEQKAISETEFDNAQSRFEVARADFKSARDQVDITSPITGRLVELDVQVGDVPKLGDVVARVARADTLHMNFGVPQNLVDKFRLGMTGELTVAFDSVVHNCTVTKVSSAADPDTRTFTIEASVPNSNGVLQPGTFAKASFIVDNKPDVLTIPQKALLSEEGIYSVFVVENDTAYARTVDVGIKNGVNAEITSGLKAGEEVVQLGQNFLSDGYPIVRSEK